MMKSLKLIKRSSLVIIIAGLMFSAPGCSSKVSESPPSAQQGANESVPELMAQADKSYAEREDLSRLRVGVAALHRALAFAPNNYEAALRSAKLNYYLGAHTTDESERDKAFRDGAKAGQRAVELQPNKADGHFWLGANYGGSAQYSALAGMSSVSKIIEEMETVIKLDEGYQGGSAYMVLGQVYLDAPKMFGGDQQKAIEVLEKGLRFGEHNAPLHVRLAQAYVAANRKADARKQLDAIKTLKPDPEFMPEYKEAIAEAEKLRNELP